MASPGFDNLVWILQYAGMGPTRCGRTLECNNTTVFLTGTVGATLVSWYPLSCVAMLFLASYLSWLCCTTCLNCVIWSNTTL